MFPPSPALHNRPQQPTGMCYMGVAQGLQASRQPYSLPVLRDESVDDYIFSVTRARGHKDANIPEL